MSLADGDIETINSRVSIATDAQLERATPDQVKHPSNLVPLTGTIVADVALAYGARWPTLVHPEKRSTSEPGNWQSWRRHYKPDPARPGHTLSPDQVQRIVAGVKREVAMREQSPGGSIRVAISGLTVQLQLERATGYPIDPASVEWVFSDGAQVSGSVTAKHTFAKPGAVSASVTWLDEQGQKGNETKDGTISESE